MLDIAIVASNDLPTEPSTVRQSQIHHGLRTLKLLADAATTMLILNQFYFPSFHSLRLDFATVGPIRQTTQHHWPVIKLLSLRYISLQNMRSSSFDSILSYLTVPNLVQMESSPANVVEALRRPVPEAERHSIEFLSPRVLKLDGFAQPAVMYFLENIKLNFIEGLELHYDWINLSTVAYHVVNLHFPQIKRRSVGLEDHLRLNKSKDPLFLQHLYCTCLLISTLLDPVDKIQRTQDRSDLKLDCFDVPPILTFSLKDFSSQMLEQLATMRRRNRSLSEWDSFSKQF
jgi:hypothetical protein